MAGLVKGATAQKKFMMDMKANPTKVPAISSLPFTGAGASRRDTEYGPYRHREKHGPEKPGKAGQAEIHGQA
jgi:hypothetical protein